MRAIMRSAPRKLPLQVHLPSGAIVRLARASTKRSPLDACDTLEWQLHALSGQAAEVRRADGTNLDLETLSLEDFHVLRTVALAVGLLPEEPVKRRCHNCDEILVVALASAVPLGPILDGELDDHEYDEPFDFSAAHPLTWREQEASGSTELQDPRSVRLAPLTVAQARSLWAALETRDRRRIGRRLGVAALGGVEDPRRIARKMDKLDDESWERLLDLFEAAHYTPRLIARTVCPSCEAENTYPAPRVRELPEPDDATEALPEPDDIKAFPSPDAFFASMEHHGARLVSKLGVGAVPMILEQGVPHVDDGGVPLLGSYTPKDEDAGGGGLPTACEVRLYYRTFRNQWLDEGPYDVDAEIAETIEHELEHHRAFLRGWDETDAQERAQIVEERRRIRGRAETRRGGGGASSLGRTWPLWAMLMLLAVLTYLEQR